MKSWIFLIALLLAGSAFAEDSANDYKQTSCVVLSNAYLTAAGYRDRNFRPEDAYNYAIKVELKDYPQFNGKKIVNEVYFDPRFAYPAGGPPLRMQMYQICMGTYKPIKPLK